VPEILTRLQQALADRYRIERELGRGGMATVYLAWDLKHDRPVALKVLRPELAHALGADRFLHEIRLCGRLQHPHILSVHDSGVGGESGLLWFTMPYIEGETLRDRLAREKQLPVEEALRLTREVALALDYAHRHGVIHRDIKPENILLSDNQALVADFGIGRALGLPGAGERLTETGFVVGTPAYMSPEQAAGERDLDGRSDTYSLAVVLYEMLAGEPPFTGATAQALLAKRLTGDVPPITRVRPTVPPTIERSIGKALSSNPADRFTTPAEFAQALSSGTAERTETVQAAARARHRIPLAPILVALGVAATLVAFLLLRRSPAAEGMAARSTRLAVLPFDNLGAPENDYLADGITDAVRGKLITVPGIQVIARNSSRQYKQTTKTPQQIGRELDVRYLLTGTVRWDEAPGGSRRVQVSPELIDVADATAEWQQPFDAPLTDVFQVQAEIAGRVVEALGVALGTGERQALAERPTANLAAYDAYLKGEEISGALATADRVALRRAATYYEQAATLDPAFALAWVQLSRAKSLLYFRGISSSGTAEQALRTAQRSLELAPERAGGHLAMGDYHSNVVGDYAAALDHYARGRRLAPASADLITSTALAEQRLGRWDAALEHLNEARRVDPRSAFAARRYAFALLWLRRYPEALGAYDTALALDPTNVAALQQSAMLRLAQGDLPGARAALRAAPREVEPTALVAYVATYWDLVWLLDQEHLALLLRLTPAPFGDDRGDWGLALAQGHALRGDSSRARAYADSANVFFEEEIRATPNDYQTRMAWALDLAYLGRKADAVREGELVVAARPVSRDAYIGAYYQHLLARIYLLAGKPDQAVDLLERLLKIPYLLSPGWLRIDPTFEPLRSHPRFQKLIQGR
jgi:eukaryotic-like serine/threonine-protein kinase